MIFTRHVASIYCTAKYRIGAPLLIFKQQVPATGFNVRFGKSGLKLHVSK